MNRTLLIDCLCGRKRLAVLEDGNLCEMHYERAGSVGLAGNIYTGRVMNVLPGMNAAFVDIGTDKNAFMQAGDIRLDVRGDTELSEHLSRASIKSLVRPGQELLVQVIKEPGGSKGPRISNHITLAGRLLVLMPGIRYIGISRKIEDEGERRRLRGIAEELLAAHGCGLIIRTGADGMPAGDISDEYAELIAKWQEIEKRGRSVKAPALIHGGDSLEHIAVREYFNQNTEIICEDDSVCEAVIKAAREYNINIDGRIRMHNGSVPLFDIYNVESDYEKLLRRNIWLKSGGSIVIDATEALTVIDVNTGKFTGKTDHQETIFRTNAEAVREIARQLRLRDIGGIIIVDFIDLDSEKRREELLELLRNEIAMDRNPATVVGMTKLGLVEITRKKKRLSAQKLLKHICPNCGGEGQVDDFETVAWRVLHDLERRRRISPGQAYIVRVSPGVAGAIISIGAPDGMKVHIRSEEMADNAYTVEPVDAALLTGAKLLPNA